MGVPVFFTLTVKKNFPAPSLIFFRFLSYKQTLQGTNTKMFSKHQLVLIVYFGIGTLASSIPEHVRLPRENDMRPPDGSWTAYFMYHEPKNGSNGKFTGTHPRSPDNSAVFITHTQDNGNDHLNVKWVRHERRRSGRDGPWRRYFVADAGKAYTISRESTRIVDDKFPGLGVFTWCHNEGFKFVLVYGPESESKRDKY